MKNVEFTLLIFCYNHELYLRQALESVLAQTEPPKRILFSDDGSTDASMAIAREVLADDPRVTFLLKPRQGLVRKFIQAQALVKDGFVTMLATDDTMAPRALEIHRKLLEVGATEWSICAVQQVDREFNKTVLQDPVVKFRSLPQDAYEAFLCHWSPTPIHGWAYSIDLYRRAGGVSPDYCIEDFQLGLNLGRVARPVLSSEVVSFYRTHPTSSTQTTPFPIAHDFARLTLREVRRQPINALRAAATRYAHAGRIARGQGNYPQALKCYALAAGLWPSPKRLVRTLLRAKGS
jgi:glycosyltransferase involved in cell wall biosynthesis